MVEITTIENRIIKYRGRDINLSELPSGTYSLQLPSSEFPSFPWVVGDGKKVAQKIFDSNSNGIWNLDRSDLIIDEVLYNNMFRIIGESS